MEIFFSGQVAIDTARKISDAIGKFNYQTQSISINNDSTSVSYNTQRDYIVPPEDISQMSQGEFTGIVADTIKQPLRTKAFRGIVSPSKDDLGNQVVQMRYPEITKESLLENQKRIQDEINYIVEVEQQRLYYLKEQLQDEQVAREAAQIRAEEAHTARLPFMDGFDDEDEVELPNSEYKTVNQSSLKLNHEEEDDMDSQKVDFSEIVNKYRDNTIDL